MGSPLRARIGPVFLIVGLVLSACAPAATPARPAQVPAGGEPPPTPAIARAPQAAAAPTPTPRITVSTPTPAGVATPAAKYGGTLTTFQANPVPKIDVQQEVSIYALLPAAPIVNGLVQKDPAKIPEIELVPDLAEKWTISADGRTYRFNLRKGVLFHDGTELTADDVEFAFQRLKDPPKGVRSPTRALWESIEVIRKPDAYTVEFILKTPSADFLGNLASIQASIYPKARLVANQNSMETSPVGTGPFRFESHTPNVRLVLVRNAKYFVPGRPYLDKIELTILPERANQVAAFRTGRVLFTGVGTRGLSVSEAQAIERDAELNRKMRVIRHGIAGTFFVSMNMQKEPWSKLKVRQAIRLAVDQAEAVRLLYQGEAWKGDLIHPVHGKKWALPEEQLSRYPPYRGLTEQDTKTAKQLLAEAGYPNGFETTVTARSGYDDETALLLEWLGRIGIKGQARVLGYPAEWTDVVEKRRDFGIFHGSRLAGGVNPDSSYAHFVSDSPGNVFNYANSTYDKLYAEQSRTLDLQKRNQILWQMADMILNQDIPAIVTHYPVRFHGSWRIVRNWNGPGAVYDNLRLQDIWIDR